MIIIQDNFLAKETFKKLQNYCNQDFKIHKIGDKEFSLLPTPKDLLPLLEFQEHDIVTSFIRSAYKGFDDDLRIHADNVINNHKIEFASVLYVNNDDITPNGTCFYKHHLHGSTLTENVSEKEFDRLILEDSNDESKWVRTDIINSVPNRFLVYKANYFHGKFPKKIDKGIRKVIVTFYKKK